MTAPSQQARIVAAAAYLAGFFVLGWVTLGDAFPELGPGGTWFYSGAAMLLLSAALVDPFYTRPSDCIVNAVAASLMASAFPVAAGFEGGASTSAIRSGRTLLLSFFGVMAVAGLMAALLKDSTGWRLRLAGGAAVLCRRLGSSRVLFSLTYLGSVYAVYSRRPTVAAVLFLAWIVVFVVRPVENALSSSWLLKPSRSPAGRVIGIRHPGLFELALRADVQAPSGAKLEGASGVDLTVLDSAPMGEGTWALAHSESDFRIDETVHEAHDAADRSSLGPVEPGSTLVELKLRLPADSEAIREGHLVSASVRNQRVLFQVIGAMAKSEPVGQSTQRRFIEVTARKIGAWDEKRRRFVRVPWLPSPGTLAEAELTEAAAFQKDAIGVVPESSYGIQVDPHPLVTHNTAVLGILGIGKTFLTFELIRRVMTEGIKVIVLDLTGEYAPHFNEYCPNWLQESSVERIASAIAPSRDYVSESRTEGGNHRELRQAMVEDLQSFIDSELLIKVYDPGAFDGTRQDSGMYQGRAGIASLTVVEVTRVISEALLEVVSDKMSKQARVCLVLEEAHSLVPEWNSTAYDGDQRAATGTAKAILQGRKYGLGTIIVTQRTANVTKTVLNQCNTVFALRTFDATGMEFLSNYIGTAYSDVLSGLEDRTAVLFGRASSCPSPVMIRVNDHDEMIHGFWNPVKSSIPVPDQADVLLVDDTAADAEEEPPVREAAPTELEEPPF